ncbi:MAG: hypothetical protein NTX45_08195 [Proteobacteria bacterium]|nr:hypothetical protein [Pseudomonadota bacterium]
MTTITVEIPDELNHVLRSISTRRHLPEADIVLELLEREFRNEQARSTLADRWLENWRGQLQGKEQASTEDERLSYLLNKHLR